MFGRCALRWLCFNDDGKQYRSNSGSPLKASSYFQLFRFRMWIIDLAEVNGLTRFKKRVVPDPNVQDEEVLITVHAAVVNGSDIIAKKRFSPNSLRSYVGLECSGIVEIVGSKVKLWKEGDKVCAILCGGGYAEKVAVHESHIFPIPDTVSLIRAATYPHASCVAWTELFSKVNISRFFYLPTDGAGGKRERLLGGQSFLIHEDRDGICDFAMQIAKKKHVDVFVTCTSDGFRDHCKHRKIQNCEHNEFFQNRPFNTFDVILSNLGPEYLERDISCLRSEGTVINLSTCFSDNIDSYGWCPSLADKTIPKRVVIQAASLMNRNEKEKSMIVAEVKEKIWSGIHTIEPYVHDENYSFTRVEEAYSLMEKGNCGKIILVT